MTFGLAFGGVFGVAFEISGAAAKSEAVSVVDPIDPTRKKLGDGGFDCGEAATVARVAVVVG